MKKLILLILLSSLSFAEVATKSDIDNLANRIDDIITQMKENNRLVLKVIEANQKATNRRFDDINKRFEDMQRLIQSNQKATNQRFEDMQRLMQSNQKATNQRFEDMNSKFNMIVTIMLFGFTLITSMVAFLTNLIFKEQKTVKELENEIKVVVNEVEKSSSKKYFEILVETIETMAKKDDDFEIILKKYHLAFAR